MQRTIKLLLFLPLIIVFPLVLSGTAIASSWTLMDNTATDYIIRSVWGPSPDNVYAVGHNTSNNLGSILHYDGTLWSKVLEGGSLPKLNTVRGFSATDMYAVGNLGTILQSADGINWTFMYSGVTIQLRDIWGTSATDLFCVGYDATILHYDGDGNNDGTPDLIWEPMASNIPNPTGKHLYGVWGTASDNVYAVGDNDGIILHYNGSSWSVVYSGPVGQGRYLLDIWGCSPSDLFAVGNNGTVLRSSNGTDWTSAGSLPATRDFMAIWGLAANDIYAVGYDSSLSNNSFILHYDGNPENNWETMTIPITQLLFGVWGFSATDVFSVGYNSAGPDGIILHYGCDGDGECDDGNPCTDDTCSSSGQCVSVNDDTNTCDDGLFCTGTESCSGGTCITSGDPCAGGDQCNNYCNEANTNCLSPADTPCGDPADTDCTDPDTCDGAGTCQDNHTPADTPCTDDGNSCTDDACDGGGACIAINNTDLCDDGNACTEDDTCADGECIGITATDCDDDNSCTDDACDPETGCVRTNNTDPCDDGNACTTADACAGGICVGGLAPNCNDNNPCTDDVCNPSTGCVYSNNTAPCSDGNACTIADACAGGICVSGPAADCNDNKVCTNDSCNPLTGCENTFASSDTQCRASAGDCDVSEYCTGSSADCPADGFAANTTVCRSAAGICDLAENCTGTSADCPADGFASSGTQCRAPAGDCDAAESCTGSATACPPDIFLPDTAECRASAGICDVAENCTGSAADCPADGFASSDTECRASAGDCDPAENCSGSAAECPADDQTVYTIALSPDPLSMASPGDQGVMTALVEEESTPVEGEAVSFAESADPDSAIELFPMTALDINGAAEVLIHGFQEGTGTLSVTAVDANGVVIPDVTYTFGSPADSGCATLGGNTLTISSSAPCDTDMTVICEEGPGEPTAGYLVASIEPISAAVTVEVIPLTDISGLARVLVKATANGQATISSSLACAEEPANVTVTVSGGDADGDGILAYEDNCPNDYNPGQEDNYPPGGNGCGDACECHADCNVDQKVNLSDLVIMKQEFFRTDCAVIPCLADCNYDGQVNLDDLITMKKEFLRTDCPLCP